MKYKLILMFIFSFLVHITIAGALVYVPYQVSMHDQGDLVGEVIWGRIYKAEGRRLKAEGRSQKSEQAPPPLNPLPQGDGKTEMQDMSIEPLLSFGSLGLTKRDENGIILRHAQDDKHGVMEPCHSEQCQAELVEALSNHNGQLGLFSDDLNANTGNDDGVLLASSTGEQSDTDEGDEINRAEKSRIYSEQLRALIEQVKKEIEKNKYYPFLAKLKGIEGTVYVNFHIGQDGQPGSVAIQKS